MKVDSLVVAACLPASLSLGSMKVVPPLSRRDTIGPSLESACIGRSRVTGIHLREGERDGQINISHHHDALFLMQRGKCLYYREMFASKKIICQLNYLRVFNFCLFFVRLFVFSFMFNHCSINRAEDGERRCGYLPRGR